MGSHFVCWYLQGNHQNSQGFLGGANMPTCLKFEELAAAQRLLKQHSAAAAAVQRALELCPSHWEARKRTKPVGGLGSSKTMFNLGCVCFVWSWLPLLWF